MRTLGLDPQEPQNRKYVDIISAYKPEFDTKFIISEDICLAIDSLWKVRISLVLLMDYS